MKTNKYRRALLCSAIGMAMAVPSLPAWSQAFPNKPVRWVLGYPAGSGLDFLARMVADAMSKDLGQPIIVDNKPGAAGALGAAALASSPPDGYTVLSLDMGTYALNPHLYSKLTYNPVKDFQMVGVLATMPLTMVVPASLNVNTVSEFVSYVKSKPPGSINFASSGLGNPPHLGSEMFQRKAGLNMVHVPYKGSPPAIADLSTGAVSLMFVDPNTPMPFVQSGKLRYLGVAMPARLPALPNVPTMKEAGYDADFPTVWVAMAVAKGTPQALVERLNRGLNTAMQDPQVIKRLGDAGFVINERMSSRQMDELANREYQEWGKKLAPMNIKLE